MRLNLKFSLPYMMWALPLAFFGYQFIFRLWPGLMMQQIMGQFSIGASEFGVLAAFYYYGYAGMQVPTAMLLDRFSPRLVITGFTILCAFAALLFNYTDNFYLAVLSRFLIGAGSAVGFLGVSKIVSQWFKKDSYGTMIGLSFTVGLMGALYGGRPVSLLIMEHGGQKVGLWLALGAFVIAALVIFFLRSPKDQGISKDQEQFRMQDLTTVLTSPAIWFLAITNLLMVGSLEGFADVWGIPYMTTAYGIDQCTAAEIISFVYVGMLLGGPILAFLSRFIGTYAVIAISGVVMALAFAGMFWLPRFNQYALTGLCLTIGVFCCYQVVIFAASADLVAPKFLGVTVAFMNCMNMMGGSFFHTFIGQLMDRFWNGALNESGGRIYDLEAYGYALSIIPATAIAGAVIVGILGLSRRLKKAVAVSA